MESERLWFRPLEAEADAERLYRWINAPKVRKYLEGRVFPQTLESRRRWIDRFGASAVPEKEQRTEVGFLFGEKGSDEAIGYVYLQDINWHARSTGAGLVIGEEERWGEGLGQEVCHRLLCYAFLELNLRRVSIQVHADQPALPCYVKVGFQQEGRLREAVVLDGEYRDLLLMAVLRHEWSPERSNGRREES